MQNRYAWLWDVDMDAPAFEDLLSGRGEPSLKKRCWAVLRLIEYAPYAEIRRLLPREFFFQEWPRLAPRVRSQTRREGMAFFYDWHRQRASPHA